MFDVRQAHKLDNPGRISELKPRELLKNAAGLTSGMTCIDFGSGTGTFSLPMIDLVGDEGKVFAVDNSAEMLAHIRLKKPPQNLVLVNSDATRTGLNDRIADICLLAFILHEVKQPGNLITEASRLLKPDGKLVVVEWKADMDSLGPPRKNRISQEQIKLLFEQVSLIQASYIIWSINHYVAIGEKESVTE
ncbi:class I SAM-dependent methyltransferase [Chloroflexota bacterium]